MSEKQEEKAIYTHLVIFEFGGRKPSSTFYNRLHEYGLYSRGPADREEVSLLEWRDSQTGPKKTSGMRGIVIQEGVIAVSSATLAKDIAYWAKREGAPIVWVGDLTLVDFVMSEKDFKRYETIQQSVSKRGPKVEAEAGTYTVTCYDEVATFVIEANSLPWNCPSCGGSNCQARLGQRPVFPDTFDCSREDYWLRTRFQNSTFEIPILSPQPGVKAPRSTPSVANLEVPVLDTALATEVFVESFSSVDQFWFSVADTLYCVGRLPASARLQGRLATIEAYARADGTQLISFNAPARGFDMIDYGILHADSIGAIRK